MQQDAWGISLILLRGVGVLLASGFCDVDVEVDFHLGKTQAEGSMKYTRLFWMPGRKVEYARQLELCSHCSESGGGGDSASP